MLTTRERLRVLKVLVGPFEPFDASNAPENPVDLFNEWLEYAIESGVQEPHAMTLSTVDADGLPDARVLILKNVDENGWHFAISKSSSKGRQISANSNVALTFYWQALGRQVRLRGRALDMGSEARDTDFLARPVGSRAAGLLGRQSDVLLNVEELEMGLDQQLERLAQNPNIVAPGWAVYAVKPLELEFWQGSAQRRHIRLRYRSNRESWVRERLWP